MHSEAVNCGDRLRTNLKTLKAKAPEEKEGLQFKNCSKAVVEREKKLQMMFKLMEDEKLAQSNGKFLSKDTLPQDDQIGDSVNGSNLGSPSMVKVIDDLNPSEDYKALVCPLCFNFLYKCQTTVCGHTFCTKCIDEYLIIKTQCFVCQKTIRTSKGSVLLPCYQIDDVIQQMIQNTSDNEVKAQWERQKCDFTTW